MSTQTPAGRSPATERRAEVTDQSLGDLASTLSEDVSRLMRQEVALAKAEARQEAKDAAMGVGRLVGAAVLCLVILILVSFAAAQLLAEWMALEWAYLIVAGFWAIVAAFLAVTGRNELKQVNPVPKRTARTIQEIPDALRGDQA